ncbi:MAG TPA: YraN family protein [Pirellulales bacterium]|nr:YraN family protein [Pirellulales bacterium]
MSRSWLAALAAWRRELFRPRSLGQRGEAAAARSLKRLGYKIVARGERGRLGEIDLVAVDGRTLVFVEVKTRASQEAGNPADAVDDDKQRRLTRLAMAFLKRHGLLEYPVRFDIVAVTWAAGRRRPLIEHFRGAFEAQGRESMFS